ncbi:polyhydroxybutyrate depolymerase [Aliidiomarina minuta]|uniref:Polyhydroxybutyrate depolymerase n=1 Tax=Aliidiomarina minuta TaxID=880057 RepID=A0A432W4P7_9GAMM|nr:PHB depolymerase family esterase [Aliidiomarina minuta]RUO24482.1 polyhydroxybutyrate depolymerase [Aliidiomarina minuta]
MRFLYLTVIGLLAACSNSEPVEPTESGLPVLKIDPFSLTVSGISSGGYMAQQLHLAHAERVKGAAIIAAGPYDCAQGSLGVALSECMGNPETPPSASHLLDRAMKRAEERKIASLGQVQRHQVWLFRGQQDTTVGADVFASQVDFYRALVAPGNLHVETEQNINHLFPTLDYGTDCNVSEPPYLGACGYDAAGELLKALYGFAHEPSEPAQGELITFNQHQAAGKHSRTLAEDGYVYVPEDCAEGASCSLHISFHGCNQQGEEVGDVFARHNGLNRWADSNRLVILYPQVEASKVMPMNPQGCWDWWGYTNTAYATKDGEQIQAVIAMVREIAGIQMDDE